MRFLIVPDEAGGADPKGAAMALKHTLELCQLADARVITCFLLEVDVEGGAVPETRAMLGVIGLTQELEAEMRVEVEQLTNTKMERNTNESH